MTNDLNDTVYDKIPVLDHGHVQLLDVMGSDEAIEAAARLSYQQGTRRRTETRGLLRYMMRHEHSTPFEAAVLKIDMKMPIFVARQFVRHRTQSLSELSARYSELPEEFYIPALEQVCYQDKKNKQGRAEALPDADAQLLRAQMITQCREAFALYKDMLAAGVARETARMVLPLNTYTQWNTTMNLRNLLHFLGLRLDGHAQWEARQYAEAIASIVKRLFPITWEAFVDFRLESMHLSRKEVGAVAHLLDWNTSVDVATDAEPSFFDLACERNGLEDKSTEKADFRAKHTRLVKHDQHG